ncbi:MAG: hypothetical protein RMJ44_12480, partial [Cytophagales bacterium]|nr:hypothetical protein [Cytophagales bacterium]
MTERLVVDVNPNSATFGQQSWVDYEPNPTLCPFASQRSISSATLYACQQPNDYIPNCISFYFVPGNNTDFNNNFGLFDISPGPNEIRERWDLARTTWELPLFSPGTIGTPNWLDCGFTNGTQEFRTSTRFDDVIHWAKVYHYQRAQFDVSNAVLFHVFVSTLIDLNQVTATLETYNSSNVSLGIVPVQNVDNLGLAAYNIYYTIDCSTNPSLNFVPHKNRTVVPDEVLPPGHVLRFAYVPPFINSIGLFRFKHNVFINGELYASQSGW